MFLHFHLLTSCRDRRAGAVEEGGAPAAGRLVRGWGDISFVLPLVLTTAGGLFGVAAGMTVPSPPC